MHLLPGFRLFDCCFVARCETGVELVVPASSETKACLAIRIVDASRDLVCTGCFPASGLEIQKAGFTSSPVFDFHRSVVIDSWRTSDNPNNRRCDLFPSIHL